MKYRPPIFWPLLVCALLFSIGMTAAQEDVKAQADRSEAATPEKKDKTGTKDKPQSGGKLAGAEKTADAAAQSAMMGLGSFGQLLPMGRKNLDVQIPSFKNGLPSSMLRADSMTRLDESMMSMEKMDIWLYAANKEADVRVQLPTAEYNLNTQVLTSEQRSRISRQDFQLEGDEMIFDTTTQQGKMTGRVEMIIFNTSTFTGGTRAADQEGKAATDAPAEEGNVKPAPMAPPAAGTPTSPTHEKK